jgi:predicted dehydrogenase
MDKHSPVVVIGAGSIGERHIRNLWSLGYTNILVFRQRNLPFRDIAEAKVTVLTDWTEVLKAKPIAAIICTPTAHHFEKTVECINTGIHVLVEKPLSHTVFNTTELVRLVKVNQVLLQVGYMMRYHPFAQLLKQEIHQKTWGNLLNIQTFWGEYLPHWHPWEDYTTSYAAKKELGGGPALTLSHDIDLANWLSGSTVKLFQALGNYTSQLKVNTESMFDLNIAYHSGASAHVHANFCQKIPQRFYKFIFDEAVVDFDYFANTLTIATESGKETRVAEGFDRNDMFLAQTQAFFERIASGDVIDFSIQQAEASYQIIKMCSYD